MRGEVGWGIVGGAVVFDAYQWLRGEDTMSHCWWRWIDTPAGKVICAAAWLVLTIHLFAKVGRYAK